MISSASGLFSVMISTAEPSGRTVSRSTRAPLILPAIAALARPAPIEAARSKTVDPEGSLRLEPSGNVVVISDIEVPDSDQICMLISFRFGRNLKQKRHRNYRCPDTDDFNGR